MDEVSKFYSIIANEWEERIKSDPFLATRSGDKRYNDKLPEISEAAYQVKRESIERYLSLVEGMRNGFTGKDKLNLKIFIHVLKSQLIPLKHKIYRMSMSKVNGFHLTLNLIYRSAPFNTVQDYKNYISRLRQIPKFVEGHIEIMSNGIKGGQIAPRTTMEGVSDSIKQQIYSNPRESPYYTPFERIPGTIAENMKSELQQDGENAILNGLFKAYASFVEFLDTTYFPATRDDIAAINLPNGGEMYKDSIFYYTTLELEAEEIHRIGLREVKRIKLEMEDVVKGSNFDGKVTDFIQHLRTSPEFYVNTPEELLEKVARIAKKIDGALPKLFKTLPRLPYGIEPIPDYAAPGNYTGYYNYGTGDGTQSGTYFVNTYDLKSRGLFEYDALSLHEAVPGHHLQLALQQENEVPNFRKYENFNSFVEGWALYCETLGFECDLYKTPYSNFGRLSFEMWRACRLVVDTGMHVLGWPRQQAIDFMSENTSLSLLNIENEVDRYISWPGQALGYKLGELKIRELRRIAEEKLGESFDVREFHDAVLANGSIPLEILEEIILDWIRLQE